MTTTNPIANRQPTRPGQALHGRIQLKLDAQLKAAFQAAAVAEGKSLSAWLVEAGRARMATEIPSTAQGTDESSLAARVDSLALQLASLREDQQVQDGRLDQLGELVQRYDGRVGSLADLVNSRL
jgi:hypothetical protein